MDEPIVSTPSQADADSDDESGNEYIGPGPGAWKELNPSADELFDTSDDE